MSVAKISNIAAHAGAIAYLFWPASRGLMDNLWFSTAPIGVVVHQLAGLVSVGPIVATLASFLGWVSSRDAGIITCVLQVWLLLSFLWLC